MRVFSVVLALLLSSGCATSAPRAGRPAPVRLDSAAVETVATLIRLEDRREWDAVAFTAAVGTPIPELRKRGALAMGRLGDPRAVPLLLPLLQDADTAVAATAAFALGLIGDTVAVAPLATLLDPTAARSAPTIAAEAATALGKLGGGVAERAVSAVLRAPAQRGVAAEVIRAALLAAPKLPRTTVRAGAERWAASPDTAIRWAATYALARRPDPAATAVLLRLAGDPDARIRSLAVRGLTAPMADSSGLGVGAVLPALLRGLSDPDQAVRINSARALGTHSTPAVVAALGAAAADAEPYLAWTAIEALGRIGTAAGAAAPTLLAAATDSVRPTAIRSAALVALARVAPTEAERILPGAAKAGEFRLRSAAASAYAELGPLSRPELAAFVRDRDARVAAAAIGAAVEQAAIPDAGSKPLLFEALGHPDVMVRAAALTGLGKLRDPATLPLLLDAFDRAQRDPQNDAALAAVEAIAALPGTAARHSFLRRFRRSTDALVRRRVAAAFPGDTARGDPLPVVTERSPDAYRAIARDGVARWLAVAQNPRARIQTERGEIEIELFPAEAPLTVLNWLTLARAGYFNGQEWPRVVPNFVIQGGDPRGDTSGGPGYAIRDEINRLRYGRGAVGMALSGPDTGGSQFFITHSAQPHLDGIYPLFGRVVAGMDVVDRILPGERILRVTPLDP